jgi:ABC-type multidrug transport system fused ATPase/permease subunit
MIEDLLESLPEYFLKFIPRFLLSILFQFISFLLSAPIFVLFYIFYSINRFVNSLLRNNTILVFSPPDFNQFIISLILILMILMGGLGYFQPYEDRTDIIPNYFRAFPYGPPTSLRPPFYLKPNYGDWAPNSKYTLWCI